MLHLRSRLAESMIESLIAITVIVLASAAAMSMLRSSVTGNNVIGEKLVAIELATEGLDAIQNIRDTNYLAFSSAVDDCWNKLDAETASDCTDGTAHTISDGEYYLFQEFGTPPYYGWTLLPAIGARAGELVFFDYAVDPTDPENGTVSFYSDWHNTTTTGFTVSESNSFTRLVTIDYDPTDSDGTDLCPTDECFEATVTVSWTINSMSQSISLSRIISHIY